jgi:hypothetical protein
MVKYLKGGIYIMKIKLIIGLMATVFGTVLTSLTVWANRPRGVYVELAARR